MSNQSVVVAVALSASVLATSPAPAGDSANSRIPIWVGAYAGAGLGLATTAVEVEGVGKKPDLENTSARLFGFVGYNFSNGPWVWGLEADVTSHGVGDKKATVPTVGELSGDQGLLGSLRLRAGYSFGDVLLYVTAGAAFNTMEVKTLRGKTSDPHLGLALGLGAEWAFHPVWTARVEGMAYGFSDRNSDLAAPTRDVNLSSATVRLGVARRF